MGSRLNSIPGAAIFWLTVSLAIIDRAVLLLKFGFAFTDSDQVILWMGGADYSHGIFHEPCVYGQNYLYMLEALIAAPFLRLGLAAWHVFPVVTSVLALAPYLTFAIHYRERNLAAACVFAAMPVLLPAEFGMMTTASHGLVTGLCVISFFPAIAALANPSLRFSLAGFAGGLALFLNPNSLPVLVVLILMMQFRRAFSWRAWLYPVVGAAPFAVLSGFVAIYYAIHPPMHSLATGSLVFDFRIFINSLRNLDSHFIWLCPVVWAHGGLVLTLLLVLIAVLLKKWRFGRAVAVAAACAVVLYSLGLPKIEDGTDWVTYAYSRMLVAVPLLLAIAFSFCSDLISKPREFSIWLLLVAIAVFAVKVSNIGAAIARQENAPLELVKLRRIADLKKDCGRIDALARQGADLVVALPPLNCAYPDASFYCYAGPALFPDYPPTLVVGFDRRFWRAEMEATNVSANILFIGGSRSGWQSVASPDIKDLSNDRAMLHLVRNADALPLPGLLRKLKPVFR